MYSSHTRSNRQWNNSTSPKVHALFLSLLLIVLYSVPALAIPKNTSLSQKSLTLSTFPSAGMGGILQRILTEAYQKLDYRLTVLKFPAERALYMSNNGLVDGEAGRVPVVEAHYKNLVRVPTPIYRNKIIAFSLDKAVNISNGWDALPQYKLGAVIGYKQIEAKLRPMGASFLTSYEHLFALLQKNRIDVAISTYAEALPVITSMNLKNILVHSPPLESNPMYHYLHKKHVHLVPTINAVLQEMQKSGRLEEIAQEVIDEYSTKIRM